jgi:hypothetical protein
MRLTGWAAFHGCRRDGIVASMMIDTFRELDRRLHDRIDVRLLWRASDDRVIVTVADEKTGERFTVDVGDDECALDVFRHPFAYAAWHRVEIHDACFEPASPTSAVFPGAA